MNYYVKEMSDKSAILMASDGYELAVFPTTDAAVTACVEGCLVQPLYVEKHYSYLQASPVDFESSYLERMH